MLPISVNSEFVITALPKLEHFLLEAIRIWERVKYEIFILCHRSWRAIAIASFSQSSFAEKYSLLTVNSRGHFLVTENMFFPDLPLRK